MYGPSHPSPFGPWAMDQQYGPGAQPLFCSGSQPEPTKATSPSWVLFKCMRSGQPILAHILLGKLSPNNMQMFGYTALCVPGSALGNFAVEHICYSGNRFQSNLHLNIHLQLTTLDLSLHQFKSNDNPPLIIGYKQEKLKNGRGIEF